MTRFLIVDDKEENVYYLSALLGASGCEVQTARHGAEALVKARQAPPTLVISDLLMPVMDGYTLLRHWKSDPVLKSIPFVVYTATYTEPRDEQLALSLGADAFILKPAEPDDFLARVRAVQEQVAVAVPSSLREPTSDETGLLKEYSEALIRKLEKKTTELEQSNRQLQADIAGREIAEAALRESEQRFRQLAENIDDVFWLTSVDLDEVYYVSPAYETVWGRECESLYRRFRAWVEAVHAEDRTRVQRSLDNYGTGTWNETYRIVRPDGAVRSIRSRSYPVRDASGNVYRLAGVSRDITEYRRLEEQFRQAQKMEAVGRLAGGIAHDFNNLLSVILSYAGLALLELEPTHSVRGDVLQMQRAGERAAELTRQLLAFSRQQLLRPVVLDLNDIIGEMKKMLRSLLGEDVELVVCGTEPAVVHVDPSQIEQIVMNLAINARDAMTSCGKLTIDVNCVELTADDTAELGEAAPGSYVRLSITDTGVGMDEATRERIFEPFFTTKPKDKGTGLGLSTVFGIVKQSQGYIQVHSEPGHGTTFRVYLPQHYGVVERARTTLAGPEELRGSESILLVEDDDLVRAATAAILRRGGYNVISTPNASEALLASERTAAPINLLLTDVVMPRMSGPELAQRLLCARSDLKVLYVSGYTENSVVHRGVADAGIAFLQKPITPDLLLRKVREVLTEQSEALIGLAVRASNS